MEHKIELIFSENSVTDLTDESFLEYHNKKEITELVKKFPNGIKQYWIYLSVDDKQYNSHVHITNLLSSGVLDKVIGPIFTCGCGSAGCAGFTENIIVRKDEAHVYWDIPTESGYPEELIGVLKFDKKSYNDLMKNTLDLILKKEKNEEFCQNINYSSSKIYESNFDEHYQYTLNRNQKYAEKVNKINSYIDKKYENKLIHFQYDDSYLNYHGFNEEQLSFIDYTMNFYDIINALSLYQEKKLDIVAPLVVEYLNGNQKSLLDYVKTLSKEDLIYLFIYGYVDFEFKFDESKFKLQFAD